MVIFINHSWLNLAKRPWTLKNLINLWAWGPTWPWLNPNLGLGSIWNYFLDLSLNPKLDPFWSQPNPIFDPEGPLQPDFGSRGPSLTQLNPMPKPNYRISIHETNDLIHSNEIFKENITNNSNTIATSEWPKVCFSL